MDNCEEEEEEEGGGAHGALCWECSLLSFLRV